eukprot:Opistho-2@68644
MNPSRHLRHLRVSGAPLALQRCSQLPQCIYVGIRDSNGRRPGCVAHTLTRAQHGPLKWRDGALSKLSPQGHNGYNGLRCHTHPPRLLPLECVQAGMQSAHLLRRQLRCRVRVGPRIGLWQGNDLLQRFYPGQQSGHLLNSLESHPLEVVQAPHEGLVLPLEALARKACHQLISRRRRQHNNDHRLAQLRRNLRNGRHCLLDGALHRVPPRCLARNELGEGFFNRAKHLRSARPPLTVVETHLIPHFCETQRSLLRNARHVAFKARHLVQGVKFHLLVLTVGSTASRFVRWDARPQQREKALLLLRVWVNVCAL